jgi:hypothetical protein
MQKISKGQSGGLLGNENTFCENPTQLHKTQLLLRRLTQQKNTALSDYAPYASNHRSRANAPQIVRLLKSVPRSLPPASFLAVKILVEIASPRPNSFPTAG